MAVITVANAGEKQADGEDQGNPAPMDGEDLQTVVMPGLEGKKEINSSDHTDDGDETGGEVYQLSVDVQSVDLRSDFRASPTIGRPELAVEFTNRSTGVVVDFLWDFGDYITSTMQNPLHIYTREGTYSVRLTVTDADSNVHTNVKEDYITVSSSFVNEPDPRLDAFPGPAVDKRDSRSIGKATAASSDAEPVEMTDEYNYSDSAVIDSEWAKRRLLRLPPIRKELGKE
ncbi:MAG: PKD domain-containing protein [Thermodesulfobacteriota bacterium]|nr:PKD domain-containing protein [Thermodesulfobacteriota bacterium]